MRPTRRALSRRADKLEMLPGDGDDGSVSLILRIGGYPDKGGGLTREEYEELHGGPTDRDDAMTIPTQWDPSP